MQKRIKYDCPQVTCESSVLQRELKVFYRSYLQHWVKVKKKIQLCFKEEDFLVKSWKFSCSALRQERGFTVFFWTLVIFFFTIKLLLAQSVIKKWRKLQCLYKVYIPLDVLSFYGFTNQSWATKCCFLKKKNLNVKVKAGFYKKRQWKKYVSQNKWLYKQFPLLTWLKKRFSQLVLVISQWVERVSPGCSKCVWNDYRINTDVSERSIPLLINIPGYHYSMKTNNTPSKSEKISC